MTQITTFGSGTRLEIGDSAVETRERQRFRTAMVLSAVSHVLVLVLLYLLWQPLGDEIVPLPPIPVTVVQEPEGQSGAAGGGDSETAASAPSAAAESASAAEQAASAEEPQPQEPTPPVETPPQPSAEVPSLAQTIVTPAPTPQEAVEPVPVRKPHPPQPKPHPTPTQTAERTPTPPTPEPATQQAPAAITTPSQTASAAGGSDQPLPPGIGGRGRGEEGPGRAAYGNGSLNGPGDDYLGLLQRWLTRFRVYPDEAKKQKEEGVALIGFTLARDGTVLKAWLVKSSGYPLLDEAALKMMHDASPVPKVPDRYQGETLTLTIPENFHMGLFDRLFH